MRVCMALLAFTPCAIGGARFCDAICRIGGPFAAVDRLRAHLGGSGAEAPVGRPDVVRDRDVRHAGKAR